jgi:hypothetical protein
MKTQLYDATISKATFHNSHSERFFLTPSFCEINSLGSRNCKGKRLSILSHRFSRSTTHLSTRSKPFQQPPASALSLPTACRTNIIMDSNSSTIVNTTRRGSHCDTHNHPRRRSSRNTRPTSSTRSLLTHGSLPQWTVPRSIYFLQWKWAYMGRVL